MPMSRFRALHVREVLAVDDDPPAVELLEPGEDAECRRLATARGTEQRHELAGLDGERQAVERAHLAEGAHEVLEAHRGARATRARRRISHRGLFHLGHYAPNLLRDAAGLRAIERDYSDEQDPRADESHHRRGHLNRTVRVRPETARSTPGSSATGRGSPSCTHRRRARASAPSPKAEPDECSGTTTRHIVFTQFPPSERDASVSVFRSMAPSPASSER